MTQRLDTLSPAADPIRCVFSFGGAPFLGSLGATHLDRPIFAITSTPGVATVSSTAR